MARTGAKRRSEPLWARVFVVCVILKQCRILRRALCHPSGVRICFCGHFPGFRPSRGSTAGLFYTAPPGLKFRLANARKIPHHSPFNFRFIALCGIERNVNFPLNFNSKSYRSILATRYLCRKSCHLQQYSGRITLPAHEREL